MCLRPVVECARKPSPVLARYPGPMSPPAAWDRGCFFQNATASTLPSTTKSTEAKARSESTMEGEGVGSESTTEGKGARSESTMEAKATAEAKPTMETKAASTKATSTKATSTKAASAKAAPAKADCSKAVTARVRDTEGAPAGKGRRSQRRTGCRNRYGG
jgi:hypothetical protein